MRDTRSAVLIGNAAAAQIELRGVRLLVASLADVIKSKRAARRPRDLAVLEVLERSLAKAAKSKR